MPTIVHFEIPSDDIERSKKFYNELFGWKIEKWPGLSEGMEYWLISTVDDKGNKALGGGMMKRQSPQQQGCFGICPLTAGLIGENPFCTVLVLLFSCALSAGVSCALAFPIGFIISK